MDIAKDKFTPPEDIKDANKATGYDWKDRKNCRERFPTANNSSLTTGHFLKLQGPISSTAAQNASSCVFPPLTAGYTPGDHYRDHISGPTLGAFGYDSAGNAIPPGELEEVER